MKSKGVYCKVCQKEILDLEHKVLFKEYSGKKTFYEYYFHVQCWIDHYNKSLDKKVVDYSNKMMKFAVPLVKQTMEEKGMV